MISSARFSHYEYQDTSGTRSTHRKDTTLETITLKSQPDEPIDDLDDSAKSDGGDFFGGFGLPHGYSSSSSSKSGSGNGSGWGDSADFSIGELLSMWLPFKSQKLESGWAEIFARDTTGATEVAGSGGTPGNNQAQNKQVDDVVRALGLNQKQRRMLHGAISGQNYGYHEIMQEARDIKGN